MYTAGNTGTHWYAHSRHLKFGGDSVCKIENGLILYISTLRMYVCEIEQNIHCITVLLQLHRYSTDLIQVHCCVAMMNWQGIELIAQH